MKRKNKYLILSVLCLALLGTYWLGYSLSVNQLREKIKNNEELSRKDGYFGNPFFSSEYLLITKPQVIDKASLNKFFESATKFEEMRFLLTCLAFNKLTIEENVRNNILNKFNSDMHHNIMNTYDILTKTNKVNFTKDSESFNGFLSITNDIWKALLKHKDKGRLSREHLTELVNQSF